MAKIIIIPCSQSNCPNWDSNSNGGYCMSPQTECYRGNEILSVLSDAIATGADLLLIRNDEGGWELYAE